MSFAEARKPHKARDWATDLEAVPVLLAAPQWAAGGAAADGTCASNSAPPNTAHLPHWGAFVGEVLDRYGPPHDDPDTSVVDSVGDVDNGVVAIEAWNEPNLPNFWGSGADNARDWTGENPSLFADLVDTAHQELEERSLGNSALKLLPGGLSPDGATPSPKAYATSAFSEMNLQAPDLASIHRYRLSRFDRPVKAGNGGHPAPRSRRGEPQGADRARSRICRRARAQR